MSAHAEVWYGLVFNRADLEEKVWRKDPNPSACKHDVGDGDLFCPQCGTRQFIERYDTALTEAGERFMKHIREAADLDVSLNKLFSYYSKSLVAKYEHITAEVYDDAYLFIGVQLGSVNPYEDDTLVCSIEPVPAGVDVEFARLELGSPRMLLVCYGGDWSYDY